MILEIPKNAETILHILEKAGYEAYVVGGCVRDSILGRSPDDWDITTSAKPEQVKALFHRTVDTGLQHGTVTVLMEKEGYEVTTYRVDGEYEDGRHPKEVTFTASLKEDLKRRDFTINAMAYNPSSGLVDLFGGLEDIERKIIRCVGDPLERFTEDALRIMRAVRFSAQLGFAIEEETRKALKVLAPNLKHVSAERIQVELVKLLMSPHPDYLRVAYEAGITAEFLPEFDACMTTSQNTPHHCYTVGEHILHSLCHVRADKVLRITMLLHDIGKPVVRKTDENGRDHFKMHGIAGEKMAAQILRRLKFDNDTIRKVTRLVKWHDDRPDGTTKAVRRAVNRIGEELFPYYLEVQQADMLAQSDYRRTEKQERLDKVKEAYETIINEHQCVSLKTLAVTGKDLIEAGCDEAGRGCLAGAVYAAAVILPKDFKNELLNDSKQLTEHQRYALREVIEKEALAWAVGIVSPEEIDKINILNASFHAMHRAVDQLKMRPQHLLIDGNRFKKYQDLPHSTVIKGDGKYLSIAAAVLAKTYRDDYMNRLHEEFPYYDWDHNKGYPTKKHRAAISERGTTPYHRMTFNLLGDGQLALDFK